MSKNPLVCIAIDTAQNWAYFFHRNGHTLTCRIGFCCTARARANTLIRAYTARGWTTRKSVGLNWISGENA